MGFIFPTRHSSSLSVVIMTMLLTGATFGDEPKVPVPSDKEQEEPVKLVKDIFKDEYSKSAPEAKANLAKKLFGQAVETTDSLATKYVLLNEAKILAIQGKEIDTALKAIQEITKVFVVDGSALKAKALEELSRSASTPESSAKIAEELLSVLNELADSDNFLEALKTSALAESEAKKAKNMATVLRAQEETKRIRTLQNEALKVASAIKTLKDSPDDPKANEAVGQYNCFIKHDWDAGLPMLAKSSNDELKTLSANDLSQPTEPQLQMAVGDGWWDYSQKSTSKAAIMERAQMWYQRCRPNLTGLLKARVDKRVATGLPPDGKPVPNSTTAQALAAGAKILVAKLLQGKSAAPQDYPKDATIFEAPKGDGRRGANGMFFAAATEWEIKGTRWEFKYERSGSANGVQIVHPFRNGHVMITVTKTNVHILTEGDWKKAGHDPSGQAKGLEKTPEYAKALPLTDEKSVKILTSLNPNGVLQIYFDDKLIGSTNIRTVSPLTLSEGFVSKSEGKPLPVTLPIGNAALIIGPLDGGFNKAYEIFFTPIVLKKGQ